MLGEIKFMRAASNGYGPKIGARGTLPASAERMKRSKKTDELAECNFAIVSASRPNELLPRSSSGRDCKLTGVVEANYTTLVNVV